MLRPICSLLFLLLLNNAYSQLPLLEWAKQFGSSDPNDTHNDGGKSVAVDADGNVYSAGGFYHIVDFDPGPGVYNMTATGAFDQSVYISKLNPSGGFIWAKQLPLGFLMNMALDRHANIYIIGAFSGTADFDPGPAVHNLTAIGPQDAYVLKLDADGNFLWVKQFGGKEFDTITASTVVSFDQQDNVIVCGSFNKVVDFDPGTGVFNLSAVGTFESFITKLSPDGNFVWARKLGNCPTKFDGVSITDVGCDTQGNIYTTGSFKGTVDFDPGTATFNFVSGGPADGFVHKLDKDGNFVWAKKLGHSVSNHIVQPRGLAIDHDDQVYTTGDYYGTQDFDPGSGVYNLTSKGVSDVFILKLTEQGDLTWAKNIGGVSIDYCRDIAIDQSNAIYTVGLYNENVDFDPGTGVHELADLYDGCVLTKLDQQGAFVFAAPFNRISDGYAIGVCLATDPAYNIYLTGSFGGEVDFDPGPGVFPLDEGRGWFDAFLLKLSKCKNITKSSLSITACNSYTLNSKTYDATGIYTQVIPNSTGCDSIITLQLTINTKRADQTKTICEGESFFAGGALQTVAGVYKDTLLSAIGCDSIVTTQLIVNPKPAPDLGADRDLCLNAPLTLTPGSFTGYTWQNSSTQSTLTVNTPGLYWVTVTNSLGCTATDSLRIHTAWAPPSNFLKPNDSICSYEVLPLQPLAPFAAYAWSTGATQSTIAVHAPGEYWLQVTDAHGCTGKDTITIFPKECPTGVYVPTAFTPNRDGRNDVFKASVFGNVKAFELTIYNRWGQVVFKTTERDKGWDGRFNGAILDSGVFVWLCTYEVEGGEKQQERGTMMLLK
jgi:gliding motility-associated-like protein